MALYFAALYFISLREIKIERRWISAVDGISKKQVETLNQYETVAAFGRNRSEALSYGSMLKAYIQRTMDCISCSAVANFGLTIIQASGMTAGLIIAAYATVATEGARMSPGSFVIVEVYISKLFWKISSFGKMVNRIAKLFTNAEATIKILRKEPKVLVCGDALNWRWESAFDTVEEESRVACGSGKCKVHSLLPLGSVFERTIRMLIMIIKFDERESSCCFLNLVTLIPMLVFIFI